MVGLGPQMVKDLDDLREKCKSALPTNERNSNAEQRIRPKSSMSSSTTRASSASKSSAAQAMRPKSSKGTRSEKKFVEPQTLPKKKSITNGNKHHHHHHHHHHQVSTMDDNDLDEAEENGIRLVEEEELDDEGERLKCLIELFCVLCKMPQGLKRIEWLKCF
jgi:G3E family GTPase